jgi:hypothetical protein
LASVEPAPSRALARIDPALLARPASGRLDVTSTLQHFAIITFAVAPDALARHLAPQVTPEVVRLDDGREVALVSAVPFFDLDFRFGFAPWLRFRFGQTNYRAYVWWKRRRAVWFFGTSLATRWVAIPRYAWKLPWHRAKMTWDVAWDGERCARYRLRTDGKWGAADVELEGTDAPLARLDGFGDREDTQAVLTHPFDGLFWRRDGRLGGYSVWHQPLTPRMGVARRARFAVFEELGLVEPDQPPHSVLLQRAVEFIVFLPPRRLDGAAG